MHRNTASILPLGIAPEDQPSQPLVSIITVNYNQPVVTEELLRTIILGNRYPNVEIIVVDNGSVTNPVPDWEISYPDVQFLRSEKNLGFAGGNNLGLCKARGDYFFFTNNDTEFTAKLIEEMVAYMEQDKRIGIASPKIMYYDKPDLIQYAGFTRMNYYTGRNSCIGNREQDMDQYRHCSGPTGYAHGAAMMLRRAAYQKAGPMPEVYFLYYEEMDWCEAIRRAGFTVHVNTAAVIYHKESVSVGKRSAMKEYFMNRNRILFVRRNASRIAIMAFYCYFFAFVIPKNLLLYMCRRQYGFTDAFFKALLWHTRHRPDSPHAGFAIP